MLKKTVFIISIYFFITGCVPKIEYAKTDAPADKSYKDVLDVTLERDNFQKTITYRGTLIGGANLSNIFQTLTGSSGNQSFLRATYFIKQKRTIYQLYISIRYVGDWAFYDQVYDEHGQRMDITSISKDVVNCDNHSLYGCKFDEDVGVNMDRKYLEKYANTGIRLQIRGNDRFDKEVFEVPSDYIKGFLAGVPASGELETIIR